MNTDTYNNSQNNTSVARVRHTVVLLPGIVRSVRKKLTAEGIILPTQIDYVSEGKRKIHTASRIILRKNALRFV
jgi:hypothetical protein